MEPLWRRRFRPFRTEIRIYHRTQGNALALGKGPIPSLSPEGAKDHAISFVHEVHSLRPVGNRRSQDNGIALRNHCTEEHRPWSDGGNRSPHPLEIFGSSAYSLTETQGHEEKTNRKLWECDGVPAFLCLCVSVRKTNIPTGRSNGCHQAIPHNSRALSTALAASAE